MKNNCEACLELNRLFEEANASSNKHDYVTAVYEKLYELYNKGELKLYMANYNFDYLHQEISRESQFVYDAYLQCTSCKRVYRLGICIRGVPSYEVFEQQPDFQQFKEVTKKNRQICYSDIFQ